MRKNTRARRLMTASTVLVAGGVMLLPVPATAQPAANGTPPRVTGTFMEFQLINVQTGKCATVSGGTSTANSLPLVQFTCDTHPSRRWILTNWDGSSFQLVNVQTGKCATISGGTSTANSLPLVQFTCDSHPSRRWKVVNWDGSSFQLVNMHTTKCATVSGGTSSANSLPLVQFDCDSHPSRRWTLRLAG